MSAQPLQVSAASSSESSILSESMTALWSMSAVRISFITDMYAASILRSWSLTPWMHSSIPTPSVPRTLMAFIRPLTSDSRSDTVDENMPQTLSGIAASVSRTSCRWMAASLHQLAMLSVFLTKCMKSSLS